MGGCASRPKAKGDDRQYKEARPEVPVSPKMEETETITLDQMQENEAEGDEAPAADVTEAQKAATEAEKPEAADQMEKSESDHSKAMA